MPYEEFIKNSWQETSSFPDEIFLKDFSPAFRKAWKKANTLWERAIRNQRERSLQGFD